MMQCPQSRRMIFEQMVRTDLLKAFTFTVNTAQNPALLSWHHVFV